MKEIELVRQMADLAALALRNARDSRAVAARNRQLTALIDSSRAMTSTLDLDEVLDVVCRQTARALDAQSSYMYAFDPEGDTVVWLAEYQRDPAHHSRSRSAPSTSSTICRSTARRRSGASVEVSLDDPDIDPTTASSCSTGRSCRRSWCR